MATVIDLPYALPAAAGAQTTPSTSALALEHIKIEPAGAAFLGYKRRELGQLSFAQDDELVRSRVAQFRDAHKEVDELDNDIGEEPEPAELLERDPQDWKTQDHYAVLGLSSRRYKATDYEIKIAHRKKVLRHHPDKKAGATGLANEDSFFKCIAKAHEILSNPEKRRQFDSVDEGVDDDDVPTGKEAPERFYELWGPVFEREGRFSKVQPVPSLGDASSPKEHVDEFYDFFYNFDSWRSFEYLDADVNEGSDSRDEKRYVEKKNRNDRARRKKEDNARLRTLVDRALTLDPRIKAFRAAERAAREAKKNKGRPGAVDPAAAAAEKKAKAEAEARAAEEAKAKEEAEKAARADAKKVREAAKKNLKKEKKVLHQVITNHNYFAEGTPSASAMDKQLNALDAIAAKLEPEQVAALRGEVEKADAAGAKAAFQRAAEAAGSADAFV